MLVLTIIGPEYKDRKMAEDDGIEEATQQNDPEKGHGGLERELSQSSEGMKPNEKRVETAV